MSDLLPAEIVREILLRLPLKTLVKFTSVCKAWNFLISDPNFISDHLNRTINQGNRSLYFHFIEMGRKVPGYPVRVKDFYSLYPSVDDNIFSLKRFPFSRMLRRDSSKHNLVVGTCNGLVCSAKNGVLGSSYDLRLDFATIVIWNPLLRKYVVLPERIMTCKKRKHRYCYRTCFGFGYDSNNRDYKVIRLVYFYRKEPVHVLVDVYSLASRSWRSVPVRSVPDFEFYCRGNYSAPMFVNGALHWFVVRPGYEDRKPNFILSFDVNEETFAELMLPQGLSEAGDFGKSGVLTFIGVEGGNSLAVVHRRRKTRSPHVFSVWVMKEYGITESWTRIFRIKSDGYGGIYFILALTLTGKVFILLNDGAIVLVDSVSKLVVEHMGHHYRYSNRLYAGSYLESLYFLNKQPDVLSL